MSDVNYDGATLRRCGHKPKGKPAPLTFNRVNHVAVYRGLYWHHGVDLGDGTVVQFSGEPKRIADASVIRTSMAQFLEGGQPVVVPYAERFDDVTAARRALAHLGQRGYDLLNNNCEHFASWVMTGHGRSWQADNAREIGRQIGVRL